MTVITKREGEYLYWTLQGKTAWEAGLILSTSEQTAFKMIRSATLKLGAPNKYAAALKAFRLGLLSEASESSQSNNLGVANALDVCTWRGLELTSEQLGALKFSELHSWSTEFKTISEGAQEKYMTGVTIWGTFFVGRPVGLQWKWGARDGIIFAQDLLAVEANFTLEFSAENNRYTRQNFPLVLAGVVSILPWQEAVMKVVAEHPQTLSPSE